MEKELKDLLIKILAKQAVIYKKVSIIENRSQTIFHKPGLSSFYDELSKESDEVVLHLKQLLPGENNSVPVDSK